MKKPEIIYSWLKNLRTCFIYLGLISGNFTILYSQNPFVFAGENCFTEGKRLYHRGVYDSAAIKLKCFLDLSPERKLLVDPLASGIRISKQEVEQILSACLKLSVCFIILKDFDSGFIYLDQGLVIFKQAGFQNEKLLTDFYFQKGNCYFLRKDYSNAIHFYQQALSHMPMGDPLKVSVYMNLGDIYFVKEDADNAIDHYRKALILLKASAKGSLEKSADILANLGAAYFEKNDNEKAIFYFLKAKKIYELNHTNDTLSIGRLFVNIGSVYLKRNVINKSLNYYRSAIRYIRTKNKFYSPELLLLYKDFASAYSKSGREDSCFFYLSAAMDLLTHQKQDENDEAADLYRLMGNCSKSQNHWQDALNYYNKSLSTLIPEYRDGEENFRRILTNPVRLLEFCRILTDRAQAIYQYGSVHPEEVDFIKRSFSDYLTSLKLLNVISKGFGREGSKLIFNETSKEFYSRVLNIGFQDMDALDEQEKEKLFGLSEKSRTNVLLETMNEKTAKRVSGIPEILLKKDNAIQYELTRLGSKYFSDPPLVAKDEQKTLLNEVMRISDLYQEHDSLIKEFELNNPKYFDMKYGDSHVSLAEIRQKLDPDESLIEYFTGDSTLFIFLVTRDCVIVKKVRINDDFQASVKKYNKLLASADIQDYFRISKMLYQFLLAPIGSYLKNDKKLIIIPDEILALVPFETLVSDTFTTSGVTNNHYLVNDFEICYHYSATLWRKSFDAAGDYQPGDNKHFNFIGYSPGFQLKNNNLPYADDEIIKVTRILKDHGVEAVSVLHDQATEEHFKRYTSSYSWIHLATHSKVDFNYPERSGLLFTEDPGSKKDQTSGNDVLYLDEIYNLGLHADLVVLSACATGTGKIIKSEGAMALTRGFLYAGASNILYSLWNITDKHTRDFMIGFYSELVSGKSYSAALRAEKLKMISRPETSLPTIWAPYVLMGR